MKHAKGLLAVGYLIAAMVAVSTLARAAEPAGDPMERAHKQLATMQWDQAYETYNEVVTEMEKVAQRDDRWAQAVFGAAVANSQGQPVSEARTRRSVELYESLLRHKPDSKFVPRALMNLGRLHELRDYPSDQPDMAKAREKYLEVAAKWPKEPVASEGILRAAATYVQAYDAPKFEEVRKGVALLENWLAEHPKDPYASVMWQYLGDTYFIPLKEERKSLDAYNQADAIGWTDKGNEGPLLWRSAILAERVNDPAAAVRYYTKVVTDTPNSGKAYEAQLALKRLGAPVPEINLRKSAPGQPAASQPGATSQPAAATRPAGAAGGEQ